MMAGDFQFGDRYTVKGKHNVGKIENHLPDRAVSELLAATTALRAQLSAPDRAALDSATSTLQAEASHPGPASRRALGDIASIATTVEKVGAPVMQAVIKVMSVLGM